MEIPIMEAERSGLRFDSVLEREACGSERDPENGATSLNEKTYKL